jgi:hypothetical protein
VEYNIDGTLEKRWVTSPLSDLIIGSSLVLHDIVNFVSRDEEILQKTVVAEIDKYFENNYFVIDNN